MLFNSYLFLLFFLPVTLIGYFGLNKIKQYQIAKLFLIIMSFWFYGYNNPYYLIIIISSIVINYTISALMHRCEKSLYCKILLIIGIIYNISILGYYKYYDFFVENINSALKTDFNFINVMLPLGISFFTFQQLSYVIDCYRKDVPFYNVLDYSLFVTFFPQLVAGPIVLHNEIVPQFADVNKKKIKSENMYKGIYAFTMGLAKKVLLADTLGVLVGYGFENIEGLGTINAIIVMLSYTLQIAFDFSGYSDMATGIGLMFNIEIPLNFNTPYKSLSVAEFWERWHMTLTRFFRTYIYIPLGGNRKGALRTYIHMLIVFFVSGLWHGANWTFIVWGMAHGLAVATNRLFMTQINKINPVVNWMCTFVFVNLTWIIFRAPSLYDVKVFYKELISLEFRNITPTIWNSINTVEVEFLKSIFAKYISIELENLYFILFFLICICCSIQFPNIKERINILKPNYKNTIIIATLLVWCIVSFSGVTEFIYFNF